MHGICSSTYVDLSDLLTGLFDALMLAFFGPNYTKHLLLLGSIPSFTYSTGYQTDQQHVCSFGTRSEW